jgi:hypothetical protein
VRRSTCVLLLFLLLGWLSSFSHSYSQSLVSEARDTNCEQPPGFEDSEYPNHVYKLSKALYGLKQAPRAWYECLRDFLITNGFKVGKADPTLFTKNIANDLFVCQIYVDDIIFGSTNKSTCEEFSRIMVQKFEMSMMGS